MYNNIRGVYPSTSRNFAILKLYIDSTDIDFINLYENHIYAHNNKTSIDPFPNSGFDLFMPDNVMFGSTIDSVFCNLKIKGEMVYCDATINDLYTCAYTVHPRSSISKTPLMLANHCGIIDSGYRGTLIGAIRSLSSNDYVVEKYTRLLQICHPSLCPIFVMRVHSENDLSVTLRGSLGFGSTGK